MAQIRTWSALMKALEKETEKAVEYAGDQIKKILHDNVQHLWYNARGDAYQYSRTYEVINSITLETLKQGKSGYTAKIYFDTEKISPYHTDDAFFNKHMSLNGDTSWGGKPISELLISWMNDGMSSPYGSFEGAKFLDETHDTANEDAVFLIEESLNKSGFATVVVR